MTTDELRAAGFKEVAEAAVRVIAEALGSTREVNGGELESVLTIYRPEGLALIVLDALRRNGMKVALVMPGPWEGVHAPLRAEDGWRCACGWEPGWRGAVHAVKDHIYRERRKAATPPLADLPECPTCGSPAGRQCRTGSGHARTTHAVRYRPR